MRMNDSCIALAISREASQTTATPTRRRMTLRALAGGSGTAAGFIDHRHVRSGERAEPAVAHDFPQNGRGLFEAPVPIDFFEFVRR